MLCVFFYGVGELAVVIIQTPSCLYTVKDEGQNQLLLNLNIDFLHRTRTVTVIVSISLHCSHVSEGAFNGQDELLQRPVMMDVWVCILDR